jgi:para-aminobenzoate synthetase component I
VSEPFAPLVERLGKTAAPIELCEHFLDLPHLLLLDSSSQSSHSGEAQQLEQFSFLAADPVAVVRSKGSTAEISYGGGIWSSTDTDALAAARRLLPTPRPRPLDGLPPFQGGIAGYIGYDWGAVLERLPRARYDDLAVSDVILGLYDWVIAWDHRIDTAWLISTGMPEQGESQRDRAKLRLGQVKERLTAKRQAAFGQSHRSSSRPSGVPSYPVEAVEGADSIGLRSTFTRRGYLNAVARVREYIAAGDIFQANLSQRFQTELTIAPFQLYQRLRLHNPAPFSAYLDFGELQILSASPERFLRLDVGGQVETRPIKGTRPRGLGPMHDAALGRALAESEKDRAENVMIVDLLRNDLSRVCRPGSVRVPELFALEHHPTVHHLVSTVLGELEPAADAADLLRAAFPGGSITGAPKVRAMEIIAELEPTQRAVYCGSIGYISATGAMDTSIVIRTYLAVRGQIYFQAGGGIVADSDPELEYRETLDKARGLIETLVASRQSSATKTR